MQRIAMRVAGTVRGDKVKSDLTLIFISFSKERGVR